MSNNDFETAKEIHKLAKQEHMQANHDYLIAALIKDYSCITRANEKCIETMKTLLWAEEELEKERRKEKSWEYMRTH